MPTAIQLIKKVRVPKKTRCTTAALKNAPQRKGICIRALTISPKKPNSAVRKIAKIRLSTGIKIDAYIAGQGHELQQHSVVLVRGGRVKDIPGMRYKIVKGKYDFTWKETFERMNGRSKYGRPKKI
jgi:small subunit ribosomal protein S12